MDDIIGQVIAEDAAERRAPTTVETALKFSVFELRQQLADVTARLKASEARNAEALDLLREVAKQPWLYDVLGSVREFLAQSAPATKYELPADDKIYEVQWNGIHGPEGWKVVSPHEYARCQGRLWDRRISAPATDEQGAGS